MRRRSKGQALIAAGVGCLIMCILFTLSEVTTSIARLRDVLFIAGVLAMIVGAVFYGLARTRTRL